MSDPREAIAHALSGFLTPEQSARLVDEVLSTSKKGRAEFNCKKCGARQIQWAEIPDARAVASALTELANQAFGRPTESSVQNDPIKFVRLTNLSEVEEHREKATLPKHTTPRASTRSRANKGQVTRQNRQGTRTKPKVDKEH